MAPLPARLAVAAALCSASAIAGRDVVVIESAFFPASDSAALARVANVTLAHGGTAFSALSMMTWNGSFSPTDADPLPAPDAGLVAFLASLRPPSSNASRLRVWGGVSLCPGPEYACMLNYTQSAITGAQLAARVGAAGRDGVMIYVSPYCNNANCKRETGKYAEGIAQILSAYHAAAGPNRSIALLANEWDHMEIIAEGKPDAIFSYQTVFYFTATTDCQKDAGALCGAGESAAYVTKAGKKYTAILEYLAQHEVNHVGQMAGATTPDDENPADLWSGLEWYMGSSSAPPPSPPAAPSPREVTIWLYSPSASNDTWAAWYDDLAAHISNVTGVAPCSYELDDAGSFVSQLPNASAVATARFWTERMSADLGLRTLPLLAASGVGMNKVISDPALASAFVAATLSEALALNLSGYNVQLEEPGNATIQAAWTSFLASWLDAFEPHGLSISIIIGGVCRGRDWMFMDCGNYRELNASNLLVIPEATYEEEPSAWKSYFADLLRGLGPGMLTPGLVYGPPLLNPGNGCLPAAVAAGVTSLYVWVNTPGNMTNAQAAWDAFGWWLTAA